VLRLDKIQADPGRVGCVPAGRGRIGRESHQDQLLTSDRRRQPACQFPPTPGRSGLEYHHIWGVARGRGQRLLAGPGGSGREAFEIENECQTGRGIRVVVHDEYGQEPGRDSEAHLASLLLANGRLESFGAMRGGYSSSGHWIVREVENATSG
jgi:hypothetical protein